MKVLSLFDGMSCGQIALSELGVNIDKYYSSELDKFAIQQTQHNFPNTIQLGDVTKWREWDIDFSSIDLLMGGSPCQGFSFAGKQLNFSDDRSKLFFVYVDIWTHIKKRNPNAKFLLENVNMKKEYLRIISEYMGVFPVRINSNLVSAQNRDRWYWSNIRTKDVGLFAELWTDIPEPNDKGILLKDILESNVPDKYFLSDKMISYFKNRAANFNNEKVNVRDKNNKATTITASSSSIDISDNFVLDTTLNVKANQSKSNCFTAGGNSGGLHSDMDIVCVAMRGRNPENTNDRKTGSPTEQRLEPKTDGKTNCLPSVSKDNLIMQINPSKESGGKQPYQQNRIYHTDGQMPALMTEYRGNITDGFKLRRLTPIECARLQTIPEWYEFRFVQSKYLGYLCAETNKIKICQKYQENARLKDAKEKLRQKNTETYVQCISKDFIVMDQLNYQLNKSKRRVNIAIEKLEITEVLECATHIIEVSKFMAIHLKLKEEKNELEVEDINLVETESKNIKSLWKIKLEGNSNEEKLYTILTLINWIIDRKIYTYVKELLNIQFYIESLKNVEQNCLSVDISDLKMESILSTSDTQIYRMLGNGWTVEVIKHILSFLFENKKIMMYL